MLHEGVSLLRPGRSGWGWLGAGLRGAGAAAGGLHGKEEVKSWTGTREYEPAGSVAPCAPFRALRGPRCPTTAGGFLMLWVTVGL